MGEPGRSDPMTAIQMSASYELVVDQIRRAIQVGRFLPGERLPTERELANQLGVSRTTVREAFRVLQGERLIETKRGRAGGTVVIGPRATQAEQRRILKRGLEELDNIFDYRLAVEPAAARLAAERARKSDLSRIGASLKAVTKLHAGGPHETEVSRWFAADAEFHQRIAEASKNPMLVKAVEDARAAMYQPFGSIFSTIHSQANELHDEIFAAIEAGDPAAAESAMAEHIQTTKSVLRGFSEGVPWHPAPARTVD